MMIYLLTALLGAAPVAAEELAGISGRWLTPTSEAMPAGEYFFFDFDIASSGRTSPEWPHLTAELRRTLRELARGPVTIAAQNEKSLGAVAGVYPPSFRQAFALEKPQGQRLLLVITPSTDDVALEHERQHLEDITSGLYDISARLLAIRGIGLEARKAIITMVFETRAYARQIVH